MKPQNQPTPLRWSQLATKTRVGNLIVLAALVGAAFLADASTSFADIILRNDIDNHVDGITPIGSLNPVISSLAVVHVPAFEVDLNIETLRFRGYRSNGVDDWSNANITVAQIMDRNTFNMNDFYFHLFNNTLGTYTSVSQHTTFSVYDTILGGNGDIVTLNTNLFALANSPFDLLITAHAKTFGSTDENYGIGSTNTNLPFVDGFAATWTNSGIIMDNPNAWVNGPNYSVYIAATNAVPEPNSLLLLTGASVCLALRRQRSPKGKRISGLTAENFLTTHP